MTAVHGLPVARHSTGVAWLQCTQYSEADSWLSVQAGSVAGALGQPGLGTSDSSHDT